MPAPTQIQLKSNIKIALLSKIDPLTGHPLYCKKDIINNEVIYSDFELMPAMDDMIDLMAKGIADTWQQWQVAQTVSAGVQVVPATGTGATIPTPGNLP